MPADRAQDEQTIEKGGDENTEDELGAAVVHEVAQEARAELRGGEREGDDGDGKNDAGDGDGGAGDGGENIARAFRAAGPNPGGVAGPFRADHAIDVEGERGETDRADGEQRG